MKVTAETTVNAPIDTVFEVFSDIGKAEKRIQGINSIEILSDVKRGQGVRWRETRTMFGKEATEEMEMTKVNPPHSFVVEAQSHGMHYVSSYFFDEAGKTTKVTMEFTGKPLTLWTKISAPIFGLIFSGSSKKALMADMTDLKNYLERA